MLSTAVQAVIGHVDEILDKSPSLILYLAMAALVYNLVRSLRGRPAAIVATALLCTVQPELYLGGTGTADMAMTIMAAGSFVFLLRWIQNRRLGDLALLILFSIACMWTKNEGRAVAIGDVIVFWLTSARPLRPKTIAQALAFALVLVVAYLPWPIYTQNFPRSDEDYDARLMSISNVIHCLPNLPHVAKAVLAQWFDIRLWGALWLLPPAMTLLSGRRALTRPVIALWLIILLQLAAWIAAFIVTPLNFDTLLPATGLRLLMQLAPAAALLIGLLWPIGSPADDFSPRDKITPAALQPVLPV
jgi:4-amino-4-deoxy-L-arabinose transferase-like glycosyltransferase